MKPLAGIERIRLRSDLSQERSDLPPTKVPSSHTLELTLQQARPSSYSPIWHLLSNEGVLPSTYSSSGKGNQQYQRVYSKFQYIISPSISSSSPPSPSSLSTPVTIMKTASGITIGIAAISGTTATDGSFVTQVAMIYGFTSGLMLRFYLEAEWWIWVLARVTIYLGYWVLDKLARLRRME